MSFDIRQLLHEETLRGLPETPHDLPYSRERIEDLVARVRDGQEIDLLTELLHAVDWTHGFANESGEKLSLEEIARLYSYYRAKFSDVGPLYIAELLSTELVNAQQATGDFPQSDQLQKLIRDEPELWQEIRRLFHRKELLTAMLAQANHIHSASGDAKAGDASGDGDATGGSIPSG